MKKILISLTTVLLMLTSAVTAFAASTEDLKKSVSFAFRAFEKSSSAVTAGIIFCVVVLAMLIFSKKLRNILKDSSSSAMTNVFILFFSVFGIATLALAFQTDGVTWSNLMHHSVNAENNYTQFEDYILNLANAGSQNFHLSAGTNTPFSLLIFFILAQFMPSNLIMSDITESTVGISKILQNQTFMFLYLILAMFICVLMYRMNRYVLRRNSLNIRDEVVAFLLVVSYPAIYCIEKGNFIAISLVLSMLFIIFNEAEKTIFRELALVALAASAAITPCTLVFAMLLFSQETKTALVKLVRVITYFIILFVTPAIFTGFDNLLTYLSTFVSVSSSGYIAGNTSIVNLLTWFGMTNTAAVYVIFLVTEIIAIIAMLVLPSVWQKTAAAAYIMLNIFSIADATVAVFVFIPFVFLLAEKKHNAINWIYMGTFALLITPFPEWYINDNHKFTMFMATVNVDTIYNANNLISLAAVQFLFVIITCQCVSSVIRKIKNGKKAPAKAIAAE